MVRYLLGTQEQHDKNRFPFVIYHWTGTCDTVSCFVDQEEANNWINDVKTFCNLVIEVNQYADTRRHRVEYLKMIIPNINSFLHRWGGARVPQDIRSSVRDGYFFFWFRSTTFIPTRHCLERLKPYPIYKNQPWLIQKKKNRLCFVNVSNIFLLEIRRVSMRFLATARNIHQKHICTCWPSQ